MSAPELDDPELPVFPVLPVLPLLPKKPPPPNGLRLPPLPLLPELELEPLALISTPRNAVVPMWTVEDPLPASIVRAMESAVLIGMAKPWFPCDWPLYWNESPARGGRVHADHLAGGVDQCTAGVTGLDVGVRLDEAAELLARAVAGVVRGDRLVESP